MIRTALILVTSLAVMTSVRAEDKPKEEKNAVEKKLLGVWEGGLCMGNITFSKDGAFLRTHYSPGNNRLEGTWTVQWDALPPTLILNCKSSDFEGDVGKTTEVKLVQLDDETLGYQYPDQQGAVVYTKALSQEKKQQIATEKELAALQGTWIPLQYDEKGTRVEGDYNCKQTIKGDRVTFIVNGKSNAEGKVVVDATKNPKQIDFVFTSGQTDLIIYARVGDQVIYAGNRDGKTRPTEFTSGTPNGGEYLMAWKIEK